MGFYHSWHLVFGIVALLTTFAISALTINRLVRRKLKLSLFLLGSYVVLHLVFAFRLSPNAIVDEQLISIERLAFAAGLINLVVITFLNPLREDRVPARYPAILQDFIVIGLLVLVATLVFQDKLLTTSAVSAVVLGFALQDTLGNAFAGLAIQSEKPFHVGHWIRVGDFEGRVAEVTWRATKLRTKSGNFVVVPNNIMSKEAITNYSEPTPSMRLEVEVGASYLVSPTAVKAAIGEALSNSQRVLKTPPPEVLLVAFDSSAMTYRARFWIDDFDRDEAARDEVRTKIYYAFARHDIEIPWPIQVEYQREWKDSDSRAGAAERTRLLAGVDLFAGLEHETIVEIAGSAKSRTYGNNEPIVRQGEPGESMFIVGSGRAVVVIEPDRREIATIEAGGYFGEMSLLTGDPRTATVLARGDTLVFEINADLFRKLGASHPQAIEQVGIAAAARRVELDKVRATAVGQAVADAPTTFIDRMRRFLRL